MFSWFKKSPKKIKVLVVINGDTNVPVNYCSKVGAKLDAKLETEVRVACNSLSIQLTDCDVDKIVDSLRNGESYWIHETWCFQLIGVEA